MGKKTSVRNIVQNSIKIENNLCNSKYFEKKKNEFPLYVYLILEIKKFLKVFLKDNGLFLHNYKINLSESELKIFVSYFKSANVLSLINQLILLKKIKNLNFSKLDLSKKDQKN